MEKLEEKHCELMPDTDKLENINVHTGDQFEPEENLSQLSEEIYELGLLEKQKAAQKGKLPRFKNYNEADHHKNEMQDHMRYMINIKVFQEKKRIYLPIKEKVSQEQIDVKKYRDRA